MVIALITKFLVKFGVGLKAPQVARYLLWIIVLFAVLVTAFCGYRAYQNRKEDKARQAIAEAVTKGIQSGAREKEIEQTIENIGIRVEASAETVEAAKRAVQEAREEKKKDVTAEDILNQLNELDDK